MNILTDGLPDFLLIEGKKYKIRTDFRVWIKFGEIMSENIKGTDKLVKTIILCFEHGHGTALPSNPAVILDALINFYGGGDFQNKNAVNKSSDICAEKVLSFEKDWGYIYAAFLSEYRIDLLTQNLHWLQFLALFSALSENSRIMKIISYRAANVEKLNDGPQKKFLRRMKRLYAFPDNRTEKEKETDFADKLSQLF